MIADRLRKERLLTPREFAGRLNIGVRSVARMIAARQIHFFKVGAAGVDACGRDRRAVRIPESEVIRLCEFVARDN